MKVHSFKLFLITVVGAGVMTWVFWPETTREEPDNSVPENHSRTVQAAPLPATSNRVSVAAESSSRSEIFIYDKSSLGDKLLISKTRTENPVDDSDQNVSADLWLQDDEGNERLIAKEVTWAKFSPDDSKIAYVSNSRELFIQTSGGKALAQVQNVSDPNWRPDSVTLSFQAVPLGEDTDLWQTVIYDLNADKVIQSSAE